MFTITIKVPGDYIKEFQFKSKHDIVLRTQELLNLAHETEKDEEGQYFKEQALALIDAFEQLNKRS